jgi:hypothetical protein
MQLNKTSGSLRLGLMAASCALLSAPVHAQSADDEQVNEGEQPWQFDTGFLIYKENDGRISANEPLVTLRKDFGDESILGLGLTFDALSGGSPNGAIPSKKLATYASPSGTRLTGYGGVPVTFTTPSGQTVSQLQKITLYQILPGQLPIDPSYHDTRMAVNGSWTEPFGNNNHYNIGGELSHELDFTSMDANGGVTHDFNDKNTTIGFGVNFEADDVRPIGGAPVEGSDYRVLDKLGNHSKTVSGALVSLTQVMSRTWLAQLNYAADRSRGYLTDPYKITSVVDATGSTTDWRFESRPDTRTRQSLYWGNKVAIDRGILDLSARLTTDDWGIHSQTLDGKWRFNVHGPDIYLEPHVRWYHQTAASFYHLFLNAGQALPEYFSSDYRLAAFRAETIGMKLGFLLEDQNEVSFRFEVYRQDPSQNSSSLLGLQGLDLNPGLRSVLFQVGWRHGF